jgi:hypothetical protein
MPLTSLPDTISSLEIHSATLVMRLASGPGTISSLEIQSATLVMRFTSLPDTISSLAIHSATLVTRSASRAARAALAAGGPASLAICVSIDLPRDPEAAGFDANAERAKTEAAIAGRTGPGAAPKEEADVTGEGQGRVSAPAPAAKRARASSRLGWLVAALVAAGTSIKSSASPASLRPFFRPRRYGRYPNGIATKERPPPVALAVQASGAEGGLRRGMSNRAGPSHRRCREVVGGGSSPSAACG